MEVPELWTALLSGEYDLVNQMIDNGADVNEPKKTNFDPVTTLLHYAVAKNDIQCVRVLANLGANFNARDCRNCTPLHWVALYYANPDIAEVLINEGSVVDARDNYQFTTLYRAAIRNSIELAKKLIARGASIDAIGVLGRSVLHVSITHHNLEIAKILISHRVIIDAKDIFGRTPLLLYLWKRTYLRDRSVEAPKTEAIELLLDNGADVNAKTYRGMFPLLYAAAYNHPASLHLLLKRGARVNEATPMGQTALHVACENKLSDVTALLLKFGANLNAYNQEGETPFELLSNSPSSEATAKVIIMEAVKREALGQFLCEGYKQMAQSCGTYSRFQQECRDEISLMQSEKIDAEDSAVSFFYILSIDEEKLTGLARNEKIVTAFESSGYVALFKIYAGELTKKFEVAKKQANLSVPTVRKLAAYIKYGYTIKDDL